MDKDNCCPRTKIFLAALGMILLALVVSLAILRDRFVNYPQWQVSIVGQGKITYEPDTAIVQLGVQVERVKQAEAALDQLTEKMDKVQAAVKKLNIPEGDIQTQSYSLYPQYDYIDDVSTLAGYTANQQLAVKLRNIDKNPQVVSQVIGQATKAGANQVLGVSFEPSNLEDLKQQARLKAIQDAKSKADKMAQTAGIKLKRIVGWWDNFVQVPSPSYPMYYDGKGGGSSPTVASGQHEIIIEVNLSYLIK